MTHPPLEGMSVLDCTQIMAGPFCTLLLADMGADVVKVEKPQGGDDNRKQGPPFIKGWSAAFLAMNRNKRSIALDLKRPQGRAVFERLVPQYDVVVENFRPGTMERLGLGYERLRELNPALIYCSISGFGRTGPYSARGGFDLVAQAMSGLMSFTGIPGAPPVKIGVPIGDLNAGIYGAYGILCAYIHRLRTGEGQLVDTSLLEGSLAYTFWQAVVYFGTGEIPGPLGSAHPLTAPYQAFRTSDGYIVVGAATQRTWEDLCHSIDMEALLVDSRFAIIGDRKRNEAELAALLEETFSRQPTSYWLELLEKGGVPAGPIYNLAQAFSDPQVKARDMMVEVESPEIGRVKNIGIPVKLSATPGTIRSLAPALGEHTKEVLEEAGVTALEISGLRKAGVIAQSGGGGDAS